MQTISTNLKAALIDIDARVAPRVLVDLFEFYPSDYIPGVDGFDPVDAIEAFAAEEITWNGEAYRRELISRGDVVRSMGEKTNQVTLTFSNVSRYLATLAQSQTIEGLFLVVRCVVPSVTDDSLVLFVGRCDKPSDIDKKQFTLTARQDFGNINQELPPNKFVTEDPSGRLPSDPLFEGFRTLALTGSFTFQTVETRRFLFFFKKKKTVTHTQQWSSVDGTPYGDSIPEVFGRCQMQGIPFVFADTGTDIKGLWAFCKGPIAAIENLQIKSQGYGDIFSRTIHLGDLGGTGSNAAGDAHFPSLGVFSLTAYAGVAINGSQPDVVDDAPVVIALIRGRTIELPDANGVYGLTGWTDNPVNIARHILTNPRFVNINPAFMEDKVNYQTALHCDDPLIDETNDQMILIPNPDLPQAGLLFHRYYSTGIFDPLYFLFYHMGQPGFGPPEMMDGDYTGFDINNFPSTFVTQKLLRKRYTVSCPITDEVKATDFLHKTIFPAAKLFLRVNKKGRYEIRSEKASDNTRLRSATAVGATSVSVLDVTPWTLIESSATILLPALISSWYTAALVRSPTPAESSSAVTTLVAARETGLTTFETSAAVIIKAIFQSAEYTARARTNSQFVSDIYRAYMGRSGDPGGIAFWIGRVVADGRAIVLDEFGVSSEFHQHADTAVIDLSGRLLIGFGLTTSEVRNVLSADYSTSGNSISLTSSATGAVTATASGATLTGGSTSVRASGTITIGGTPAVGNIITATIDGVAVPYTLDSTDTTSTAAAMLTGYINGTQRLRQYIRAYWSAASPTVITIKCLHGALNLDAALLKAHAIGLINPGSAPTIAAAAGGTLPAGTWKVAYANINTIGSTSLTPLASVVVTANQKINVSGLPALPSGATGRNFYISDEAGSTNLRFSVTRVDAVAFSITAAPLPGAALPPSSNTSAEELMRVAMSFATNSQDIYPSWRPSQPTTSILIGDIYLPTTPNGHKYQVSAVDVPGFTGTTEPTWPTSGTVVSGDVTFTEIGATVLGQAGLTRANIVKDSFKWPLGSRQSSVNQIKIPYRDAKNDFALTPYRVNDPTHQAQVKKIYPLEIDGSAIDNFHQMNRIANWVLSKNREGDWFNSLGSGPQAMVLEEGDPICSSDDSGGLVNVVTRIEEIRIKPNHDVVISQARRYSTIMFSDDVGSHIIPMPSTLRFSATANSLVEFIDNFPIRDADALIPGFYVAISRDLNISGDWRGWALYADYGDGYVKIAEGDIPVVMGTATTTLPAVSNPSVFDRINSITFTLKYGQVAPVPAPFASVTEDELMANSRRNLFIIGNEYVQAATVVSNGNQSYTISKLLRGRFGTDTPQFLTHGSGERVIYLDGSEQLVPIDLVRLNTAYNYKAVTTNQDVSAATTRPFTWAGGTVRCLAPVNVSGIWDAHGNILLQWIRRSRSGPGLRPRSDVPLAEETSWFEIEIYSGSTVLRTIRVIPREQQIAIWRVLANPKGLISIESDGSVNISGTKLFSIPAHAMLISEQTFQWDERDTAISFAANTLDPPRPPLWFGLIDVNDLGNPETAVVSRGFQRFTGFTATDAIGIGRLEERENTRLAMQIKGGVLRYFQDATDYDNGPIFGTKSLLLNPGSSYRLFIRHTLSATFQASGRITAPVVRRDDASSYVYSVADQINDFGSTQPTLKVRIYQISSLVGRGDYAEATLSSTVTDPPPPPTIFGILRETGDYLLREDGGIIVRE